MPSSQAKFTLEATSDTIAAPTPPSGGSSSRRPATVTPSATISLTPAWRIRLPAVKTAERIVTPASGTLAASRMRSIGTASLKAVPNRIGSSSGDTIAAAPPTQATANKPRRNWRPTSTSSPAATFG
jgi:hypothetical protein